MLAEVVLGTSAGAFVYHHFVYPWLLPRLGTLCGRRLCDPEGIAAAAPPSIAVIVPAHNEAAVIARKIANLEALAYPRDRLEIIVVCDGCTDETVALARHAVAQCNPETRFWIVDLKRNIGKIAALNRAIGAANADVIVASDASAIVEPDALQRIAGHFADHRIGVVAATYQLVEAGSEGERAYWAYQTKIKVAESRLAAPIGVHGAFYAFRRAAWTPLEPDTINDDVILPMRIVAAGYHAVYDADIVAIELERTQHQQDLRRRLRISAGNIQQIIRLSALADLRRPRLAFVFLSGKALRAILPFLMLAGAVALAALATTGEPMYQIALAAAVALAAVSALPLVFPRVAFPRPVSWLSYLAAGHAVGLVGAVRYLAGLERKPWKRAPAQDDVVDDFIPPAVAVSKRVVDIFCGLGALAVMAILFVPIALAIKIDSRGPIFYRQQRVGRQTPRATQLFHLIKFRTMRVDAEAATGAVWASKNDPRITRVGRFMRKTRLDELPQCINVLRGEMSVIGPRPERPVFFGKLESAIPFYAERTYGLRPGITGLAQVNQAYDESIEDVRNKVLYDHAYAARLTNWLEWLRTDFGVLLKTVQVMALGKGQ